MNILDSIANALKTVPYETRRILTDSNTTINAEYYPPDPNIAHDAGQLVLRFSRRSGNRVSPVRAPVTGAQSNAEDRAFLVAALKDAWEKNRYSFISLKWFKTKYLPSLGVNLGADELNELIRAGIAQGELIVEKVSNPNPPFYDTTTIRTPDMPVATIE